MTTKNAYWSCLRLFVLVAVALIVTFAIRKAKAADDEVTVVHVLATDAWSSEFMEDACFFTVYRTGPTNEPLTVQYRVEGTASNGVDYDELTGSVVFEAGSSTALVPVQPNDDSLVEGNETVALILEGPVVDVFPPPYVVGWPGDATAYIEDNDFPSTNQPPQVRMANPPDGSVFEGPVDLRLIAHATDADGRVLTVEFFDGDTSLGIVSNRPPIIRPIPLAVDALELSLESDPLLYPDFDFDIFPDPGVIRPSVFVLSWQDVPPGHHVLTAVATDNLGGSSRSEPVEIKVTEPHPQAVVNVRATDPIATEPGPTGSRLDTATFTIGRTGPTDLPLTVYYRLGGDARNGADYRELPHSVVIPRGATRTEVVIEPLDDNLVEGPEKVVLTIVPPVCIAIYPPPPECYAVGKLDSARAVINDNDPANLPPVVEIVRPLDGSVYLAPVDIAIVAQARDFDGRVVTVEFFEGTNSLGVVSNRPSLLTARTPQFALKWPDVKPGHYILTAEATDNDGAKSHSRPVEIKVVERTLPPVVSVEATDPEAAEPSSVGAINTATFTFKRTGPTDRALVVFYSVDGTAENGVDYREIGTRVIIPSGASSAPVVVQPIDDRLVEGTESVSVTLEPPLLHSASILPIEYYIIGTDRQARAIIRDNDVAPSNQPPKVALIHPANGDVFAAPADISLVAETKDADGFVRSVEFFAGDTSLGVVSNSISAASNILPMPEQFFRLSWNNVRPGSYVLTAKATDNRGAMSVSEAIRIRVIEESRQPVVTIEATDPFASEGDWILEPIPLDDARVAFIGPPIIDRPNIATFTVKRDRGTNIPLTVYLSFSGTAENGVDYRRLDRSVTIPVGAWSAGIVVFPLDDRLVEGTETVVAALEPIACIAIYPPPPDCYLVGDPDKAVAYIRDNDFANQPPKVEITKPASGEIFISPADVEIVATVRDLDGYVTEVEFFDGTNSIGKESRVYIVAPPPGEVHTFSIIWSNAPVGVHALTAVATDERGLSSRSEPVRIEVRRPGPRQVTIRATDPWASEGWLVDPWPIDPILPIDVALAANAALEPVDPNVPIRPIPIGPNNAIFTISRNCCTNEDWVVGYKLDGTAENGVDYQGLSGVVRLIRGNWSAPIIVEPIDDRIHEGTETVECSLIDPCTDPLADVIRPWPYPCYEIGDPGKALAWIRDNDPAENHPPKVAIVKPETGDQFRKGAEIPIVVQAVDEDGWVGRVEFFANGRGIGEQAIYFIIPPPPGQLQRFSMVWSNAPAGDHVLTAVATDDQGATSESRPVKIAVIESPVIPVVNIVATDGFAREGNPPNTAAFRIRRSGPTNEPLTVHFAIEGTAENGVDYTRIESSVTIPAGRRAAGVIITPIDDRRVERIETVILRLRHAALYNVGRWSAAGAIIVDNDYPTPGPICLPDRTFHARLKGANGQCYRLEISNDLKEWEALDPCVVLDDAIHFLDCEEPHVKARFYRAIPVPDVEMFSEE